MKTDLIQLTDRGLYCQAGDFYIDPSRSVSKALLTHAHADHARKGSAQYLAVASSTEILRHRLGDKINVAGCQYGETIMCNGVKVSFHPAGHILGSAQIRLEHRGEIWVVSGDYKTTPDATCVAFEPVLCHTFITEATFGLPVYRWQPQAEIFQAINQWWQTNSANDKTSVLLCYSLGKAQRLLTGLDETIGPIYVHDSVEVMTEFYRQQQIQLPPTIPLHEVEDDSQASGGIILMPPQAMTNTWSQRFTNISIAFASGWMRTGRFRGRQRMDVGFALSDHADWPGLLQAIKETTAKRVLVMHGQADALVSVLTRQGYQAEDLSPKKEFTSYDKNLPLKF